MRMLARVEGMPLESLQLGVPWNWKSFGEYLDRLDGTLAINAGFLVGHSALRCAVMGERAVGAKASDAEIAAMVALLHRSLDEGGLGFSSSWSPTHNDGDGAPVPSRAASREELLALAGALRGHDGHQPRVHPGRRPLHGRRSRPDGADVDRRRLSAQLEPAHGDRVRARGRRGAARRVGLRGRDAAAQVIALTLPQLMSLRLNFTSLFILDALPGWSEVVALSLPERKRALADPAVRERLANGAKSPEAGAFRALAVWDNMTIEDVVAPANERYRGRNLGEVARERAARPST